MLLALDTSTHALSIALHTGPAVVAEHTWQVATRPTAELAPQVALMLRRANVEPRALTAIAVALGPGSYTGLRIGLGFAKGLALAQQRPVLGVPTFDILMHAQPMRPEPVVAVLQAGRGHITVATYQWDLAHAAWANLQPPHTTDWATLLTRLTGPTHLCGEIDEVGQAALHNPRHPGLSYAAPAQALRRATHLAEVGWARLQRLPEGDNPANLAPIYGGPP